MNTFDHHNQIWQSTLDNLPVPETKSDWNEGELEQKAQLLIDRCFQILAEIKEKRDRMMLPS